MTKTFDFNRRQRGGALVEFAISIFVLLMIVAGVVEFGRAMWYYDALSKATRDGARFLSTVPVSTIGSTAVRDTVRNRVATAAAAAGVPSFAPATNVSMTCDGVTCTSGTAPDDVTVEVTGYTLTLGGLVPFIPSLASGGGTYVATLTPQTTMPYMN